MSITEGNYNARAVTAQWDKFKNKSGEDRWVVEVLLEIVEGEHAGFRIKWNGYYTDAAWPYTYRSLRACGDVLRNNDIMDLENIGENIVPIDVILETAGNGKEYPKVNRLGGGGGSVLREQQASRGDLAAFRNRMKGELATIAKSAPAPAAKKAPPVQRATTKATPPDDFVEDDDIGF